MCRVVEVLDRELDKFHCFPSNGLSMQDGMREGINYSAEKVDDEVNKIIWEMEQEAKAHPESALGMHKAIKILKGELSIS